MDTNTFHNTYTFVASSTVCVRSKDANENVPSDPSDSFTISYTIASVEIVIGYPE